MSRRALSDPRAGLLTAVLALSGLALGLATSGGAGSSQAYGLGLVLVLVPLVLVLAVLVEPSKTVTAGLVLSVLSGHWANAGVPVGLDRVVLIAGVIGVALRAREDAAYRPRLLPVHLLLGLVAAVAIESAIDAGTLFEHDAFFALLDRLGLISFGLFVLAPVVFRTVEQRTHLLVGIVAVGAYLGVTAVAEGIGADFLVFPKYILDPLVGIHADRARGPFVEAAANGLALYACVVGCVIAAARWRGRPRTAALIVGGLCLAGILFTLTRQAWLGAVLGTLVGIGVTPRLRAYAVPLLAAGALLVVGALAVVPGLGERADARANDQRPVWDRLNSDRAGLHMVEARPLLGFGWGRFGKESGPYYTQAADYPLTTVRTLHSVLLSNAVELGLIGATLWAAALLVAIGQAITRRGPPELEQWRRGLIAFAACWLVVSNFTPLGYSFSNYLLWIWAGMAGASAGPSRAKPQPELSR